MHRTETRFAAGRSISMSGGAMLATLSLFPAQATARTLTATAEEICQSCYVTSLSADGKSATGAMADNVETFLWKSGGTAQRLGRSTLDTLGVQGGQPAISADGTRIASTILSKSGKRATSGYWQAGAWTQITPPLPPDAGSGDHQDSAVWGMSGDGTTIVGLYWRYGQPTGGTANGFAWTKATHMVGLPTAGGDSRVNFANQDGTVLAGWESDATAGFWQAAVWVNGTKSIIGSTGNWSIAQATNPAGTIIAGQDVDPVTYTNTAALWRWTSGAWQLQLLGVLKGTDPVFGQSIANAVSANGKIVGGMDLKQFDPGTQFGFIWTPRRQIEPASRFFGRHGYVNPGYQLTNVVAITPDGRHFGITEQQTQAPYTQRSVLITLK